MGRLPRADEASDRRALDLDLQAAGIPKVDDRGRSLDFHALRTTFATWLSAAGVAARVAQAAMRHSDLKLTMGVYTDPRLLDVAGAVEALPALGAAAEAVEGRATGTEGQAGFAPPARPPFCAPLLSAAGVNLWPLLAIRPPKTLDNGKRGRLP